MEAIDIPEGAHVEVEIESVADPDTETDASGKLIDKAILKFKAKKKRLILNKTNYRVLKGLFTDATKWVGKKVRLQRRYFEAFGIKNEIGIRIIPPDGTPIPKSVRDNLGTKRPQ